MMLVFDTEWSLFSKANRADTTAYLDRLVEFGFDGFVSWVWFHGPSSANVLNGHGNPMQDTSAPWYATHQHLWDIRRTLDDADARGLKVCVGTAWQNLYLPGGGADAGNPISDAVRGILDTPNRARDFANDIRIELPDSPAVHAWVVGGDPGTNSTPDNLPIVQAQIDALNERDHRPVVFHSGTANYGGHYYAQGLTGLAAVALQTGHQQNATATRIQLTEAVQRYSADNVEVWQGEPRYHSINFDWVGEQWRNPGTAEMVADAQAAKTAGVETYWYGNNDRWQSQNLVSSFGDAEREVLALLQDQDTTSPPAPDPVEPPIMTTGIVADIMATTIPGQAHDLPLSLPAWDWQAQSKINLAYDQMGQTGYARAEARGAIWRTNNTNQTITLALSRIDYYAHTPADGWTLEFSDSPKGAFLGTPGTLDDPFVNTKAGAAFTTTDGGDTWLVDFPPGTARMLHFWAGRRHPIKPGQNGELAVCRMAVVGSANEVLVGAVGVDYYAGGENNNRAPGPGIGRYRTVPGSGGSVRSVWLTAVGADVTEAGLAAWIGEFGLPAALDGPVVVEPEPEPVTDSVMAFYARGTTGTEIIEVSNDRVSERVELGTAAVAYGFPFSEADGVPLIAFVNDGRDDTGTDRNVYIDHVAVSSAGVIRIMNLHDGLVSSYGKWDTADQRCDVVRYGAGGWLHCNGWIDVQDLWDELAYPTPPVVEPETEPPVECPECPECDPCPPFGAADFAEYVTSMTVAQALAELLDAWEGLDA